MNEPLWAPSTATIANSQLVEFCRQVGIGGGPELSGYADLHEWSVAQPGAFWQAVWHQCGVIGVMGEHVYSADVGSDAILTDARFFADARLNFAENLLRRNDDTLAVMFRGESGVARDLTWRELHRLVSQLQQAMVASGVRSGDRVAAWLPNVPETIAVMLAAASIGAVFSSGSPDFGVTGMVDRFGQIEPVLLFATDAYAYAGNDHDCLGRLAEVRAELPTVRQVIMVPYLNGVVDTSIPDAVSMEEFVAPFAATEVTYERLPFDHPLYILFSSGTTGAPKCLVHRAGGILIKHLAEHRLSSDMRPGERMFYFTTAGWMMWNWMVSALASEVTLILYDGSPFEGGAGRLFALAEETRPDFFGVSAKFIDAVGKSGLRPKDSYDLSSIRQLCSTGSVLVPEGFAFVYEAVKEDVHLASISGGTDLCGCLVAGDSTSPVYSGEIQRPALGLAIDIVDADGNSAPVGQPGELVCRSPFPTMPLRFWNDPDGSRYHEAYFARFEAMWCQGDYAEWTPHGGVIIHGRSDATLNPGGVRIGTAEIYRQVDGLDQVIESVVIGQSWDNDTRVVLFVVLRDGEELSVELQREIRQRIRTGASPRHVPAVIGQVADLPRTRSGKVSELAVRDVVEGRPVTNTNALANPEALDLFKNHPAL